MDGGDEKRRGGSVGGLKPDGRRRRSEHSEDEDPGPEAILSYPPEIIIVLNDMYRLSILGRGIYRIPP